MKYLCPLCAIDPTSHSLNEVFQSENLKYYYTFQVFFTNQIQYTSFLLVRLQVRTKFPSLKCQDILSAECHTSVDPFIITV